MEESSIARCSLGVAVQVIESRENRAKSIFKDLPPDWMGAEFVRREWESQIGVFSFVVSPIIGACDVIRI
jgi:hypothetical protein